MKLLGPRWLSLPFKDFSPEKLRELLTGAENKGKVAEPLNPNIFPTVRISAPLGVRYQDVKKYWQDLKFECQDVLGEEDLLVTPSPEYKGTLGEFMIDIIYFRCKFRNMISVNKYDFEL